jgi:hypothetical protein
MMIPVWLYIVIWGFAALGAVTFVCRVKTVWARIISTANDLASTLKDATEIARAYREDLAILRQIAQSGTGQQLGDEPESIIPQPPAVPATMPPPYFARFSTKPEEPDAPAEPTGEVDVTATEEEILEQEKNEAAAGFEVTERMKAATRDADNARIRELTGYGISEKPEAQ